MWLTHKENVYYSFVSEQQLTKEINQILKVYEE